MERKITSIHNPKIKQLLRLHKAAERRDEGLFLVEGQKEIQLAMEAGFRMHSLYVAEQDENIRFPHNEAPVYTVSTAVYERITYGVDPMKVLAVFYTKERSLNNLQLQSSLPMIVVLERVEKPGNLGAIMRTANAAGVDAVIICDTQTDIYNPNVIRSSRGCVFSTPLAVADSATVYRWLKARGINIACAALTTTAIPYYHYNYKCPLALVFGTESQGLSDFWLSHSDAQLIIPMKGSADSLNVSVSAAIIIFEASRQRNANNISI